MSEAIATPDNAGIDEDALPDSFDHTTIRLTRRPDTVLPRDGGDTGLVGFYDDRRGDWAVYRACTIDGQTVVSLADSTRLDATGASGDVPYYDSVMGRYLWRRTAGYCGDETLLLRLLLVVINPLLAAWYTLRGRPFRFQLYRADSYAPDGQTGGTDV